MKKTFAILMALCMTFVSGSFQVFAKETTPQYCHEERVTTASLDDSVSTYNTDYFTFRDNAVLDGYQTIVVTPGSGEALKIHTYIMSGSLKVQVKKSSALFYKTIATWNNNGHHYADLVTNTDGSTYYVRLFGAAALFNGGIYSE